MCGLTWGTETIPATNISFWSTWGKESHCQQYCPYSMFQKENSSHGTQGFGRLFAVLQIPLSRLMQIASKQCVQAKKLYGNWHHSRRWALCGGTSRDCFQPGREGESHTADSQVTVNSWWVDQEGILHVHTYASDRMHCSTMPRQYKVNTVRRDLPRSIEGDQWNTAVRPRWCCWDLQPLRTFGYLTNSVASRPTRLGTQGQTWPQLVPQPPHVHPKLFHRFKVSCTTAHVVNNAEEGRVAQASPANRGSQKKKAA